MLIIGWLIAKKPSSFTGNSASEVCGYEWEWKPADTPAGLSVG